MEIGGLLHLLYNYTRVVKVQRVIQI